MFVVFTLSLNGIFFNSFDLNRCTHTHADAVLMLSSCFWTFYDIGEIF